MKKIDGSCHSVAIRVCIEQRFLKLSRAYLLPINRESFELFDTNYDGDGQILILKLLPNKECKPGEIWKQMSESIIAAIKSDQSRSKYNVPLVAVDTTQAGLDAETFERLLRYGKAYKTVRFGKRDPRGDRIVCFIHDRGGELVICGHPIPSNYRGQIATANTLQEGMEILQKHNADLQTDEASIPSEVISRIDSRQLCLVGCPEKDVGDLPDDFRQHGIEVKTGDAAVDGDRVVFCISASAGPLEGTRKSVRSLQGKTIVPIAIVLTCAGAVDDESLRELVNAEERMMLTTVLSHETVDGLPLILDLAPDLVNQILQLAANNPSEEKCRYMDSSL